MTEYDIADYPELVGHEYNWNCAICLMPAQAGVWLEFQFIEFHQNPLIFASTRKHGHTVSHVAINFISSVSHRPTLKLNLGYLDCINAVYTIQILPKYQTSSFFMFLDLKMTKTKTTRSVRAAAKQLGTKRSVVAAKNKSNEASRMIAAKVAKDIMEKKGKAQKT